MLITSRRICLLLVAVLLLLCLSTAEAVSSKKTLSKNKEQKKSFKKGLKNLQEISNRITLLNDNLPPLRNQKGKTELYKAKNHLTTALNILKNELAFLDRNNWHRRLNSKAKHSLDEDMGHFFGGLELKYGVEDGRRYYNDYASRKSSLDGASNGGRGRNMKITYQDPFAYRKTRLGNRKLMRKYKSRRMNKKTKHRS